MPQKNFARQSMLQKVLGAFGIKDVKDALSYTDVCGFFLQKMYSLPDPRPLVRGGLQFRNSLPF